LASKWSAVHLSSVTGREEIPRAPVSNCWPYDVGIPLWRRETPLQACGTLPDAISVLPTIDRQPTRVLDRAFRPVGDGRGGAAGGCVSADTTLWSSKPLHRSAVPIPVKMPSFRWPPGSRSTDRTGVRPVSCPDNSVPAPSVATPGRESGVRGA
jgi:hypothetical protein